MDKETANSKPEPMAIYRWLAFFSLQIKSNICLQYNKKETWFWGISVFFLFLRKTNFLKLFKVLFHLQIFLSTPDYYAVINH